MIYVFIAISAISAISILHTFQLEKKIEELEKEKLQILLDFADYEIKIREILNKY